MKKKFTLGVEEEFQIIDPVTRNLKCRIAQLMDANTSMDGVELHPELHQSVVEVNTPVCEDISAVRAAVTHNRVEAARVAHRVGLRLGAASTHPFARWQDQVISNKERYAKLVDDLQDIARANLIYGMHVHVGIEDKDEAMAVFNSARYFLPHLLALSTSSPFFDGRMTGLKSSRTSIFSRLPRTGIPGRFSSYHEYESFVATLVKTGSIDDGARIWWDLRPHPRFSTLEFRICDLPTRVDDVVAITALVQCLVAKLSWLHQNNQSWQNHRFELIRENKWRAARYGSSGPLIDFGKRCELDFADVVAEMVGLVSDVGDDLGCTKDLNHLHTIVERGTSADRQIKVFEESGGDLKAVVDFILEETVVGLNLSEALRDEPVIYNSTPPMPSST